MLFAAHKEAPLKLSSDLQGEIFWDFPQIPSAFAEPLRPCCVPAPDGA
jgi:hypothetical protein